MEYDQACKQATTDQGLDPVVAVLRDAEISYFVEQTGGFVMNVNIYLGEDDCESWIGVSQSDDGTDADGEPSYMVWAYLSVDEDDCLEPAAPLCDVVDWVRHGLANLRQGKIL